MMKFLNKPWSVFLFLLVALGGTAQASFQLDPSCGSLDNNYLGKPSDYRSAPADQRNLVERAHFHVEHSQIQKGRTSFKHGENSGSLMGGFDYTLRVFPNHHLALQDIARLGKILKTERPVTPLTPWSATTSAPSLLSRTMAWSGCSTGYI